MSKVVEYVGFFHALKDRLKESWTQYWLSDSSGGNTGGSGGDGFADDRETNFRIKVKEKLERLKHQTIRKIDRSSSLDEDFSHLTRPKTRRELLRISAAVMGIEFAYAAETAFVSPLLLNIGLRHRHMTLMWCLSPLVGFFATPLLGSLSDGCRSQLGKRRPFIILLSIGVILGLILVPNGTKLGRLLGDTYKDDVIPNNSDTSKSSSIIPPRVQLSSPKPFPISQSLVQYEKGAYYSEQEENSANNASSLNLTLDSLPNSSSQLIGTQSSSEIPEYPSTSKKRYFFSKYSPTMSEHGYRARNDLHATADESEMKEWKRKSRLDLSSIFDSALSHNESDEERNDSNSSKEDLVSSNLSKHYSTIMNSGEIKSLLKNAENQTGTTGTDGSVTAETQTENKNMESEDEGTIKNHPWGLLFTVIGTVLLDFDADACQSPSRAYMLDVTIPEDHARGLSTFTVMAGLGGCLGYLLGALNWENTFIGHFFGGQVRAVFTLVLFIFIACVITTVRSFREIPIDRLWAGTAQGGLDSQNRAQASGSSPYSRFEEEQPDPCDESGKTQSKSYGATADVVETSFNGNENIKVTIPKGAEPETPPTFREYVQTIVQLPKSLQWLCLTNFFCWMSLVCYSLYFTDFVGEAVFNGDPTAPRGSVAKMNYDSGVRFGCYGMSLYSLSCSLYSLCIESLVSRFGAKRVYITGQIIYSVGMVLMAITRHPFGVIVFSWTAGIMYATLFTMPYLLVARYHAAETFDVDIDDLVSKPNQVRGLGTDVAIVSSMVFLAQMTQALTLGSIVTYVGSTTAIVCAAAVFASCGALSATKVLYLDL